jgi:D-alanyl-D-alanine carboxypeptidase/D-alanyl-D-alanine-endopeptidase (penicillin-binding protein 4)
MLDATRRPLLAIFLTLLLILPAARTGASAKEKSRPARQPQAAKGQQTPAVPAGLLRQRIEAVLATPEAARAQWGIEVVSADSGKTLYALNEHKLFVPASNMKLFTAALALATLGPQFRFHTTVETATPPDKYGRLPGDLWLIGGGDPNLSSRQVPYQGRTERDGSPLQILDSLADQVVRQGVRLVDGDLVADDSYFVFERYGEGWAQDDLMWSYGAPVSALSINDNVLFLDVLPGQKPGDRALLRLEPFQDYYRVENRVQTVPGQAAGTPGGARAEPRATRHIAMARDPGSYTLEIWGTIPQDDAGLHEQVAIEDPALFSGRCLRQALLERGVVVHGQVRVQHAFPWQFDDLRRAIPPPPPSRLILASHDSPPLAEALKVLSKVSQNLHAEMVLRTVARERRGIGSVRAAIEETKDFLDKVGVPQEEYTFFDGSGLSRRNLVSPAAVVALLQYMDRPASNDVWRGLLPVAGIDGSLSTRFRQTAAAGQIQAKTGSMGHVAALSGYATTRRGERVAFSILVNNYNESSRIVEALIDRIALAIVEEL